MSLVMSLVMYDVAVISGDLRAVNIDDPSQKLGGVRKVFRVNDKVAYGLTGDLSVMIDINSYLRTQETEKATVQEVAEILQEYLTDRLRQNPDMQIRAHIIGVGKGDKVTMIELYHDDNYELHEITPEENEVKWAMMFPDISPDPFITEQFGELPDYSAESLADMLASVNAEVAKQDDYVSPECEVITITK